MDKYVKYMTGFKKEDDFPFNCPQCNRNTLFLRPENWLVSQTVASQIEMDKDYADYNDIEYVFHTIYECCNPSCKEKVFVTGKGFVDLEPDFNNDEYDSNWVDLFVPRMIQPIVSFFEIPSKTPKKVAFSVKEAFDVVFHSTDFASNKMRTALEYLLTCNGIELKDKKGGYLKLHTRIEKIPENNILYKFAEDLLAIKWIGNAGSHGDKEEKITLDIIMSEFLIMKNILEELYGKHNELRATIKQINSLKRPPTFWEKTLEEWENLNSKS